ncbi:MAG TPA: hypothetical protein VL475_03140, partial [Planctomycetaceae bacterium]|nr:hypothetical protein [Planctomycetaceae bacterium]
MTAADETSTPEKSTEPWASWERGDGLQGEAALERLAKTVPAVFGDSKLITSRWAQLSFYKTHRLIELT